MSWGRDIVLKVGLKIYREYPISAFMDPLMLLVHALKTLDARGCAIRSSTYHYLSYAVQRLTSSAHTHTQREKKFVRQWLTTYDESMLLCSILYPVVLYRINWLGYVDLLTCMPLVAWSLSRVFMQGNAMCWVTTDSLHLTCTMFVSLLGVHNCN